MKALTPQLSCQTRSSVRQRIRIDHGLSSASYYPDDGAVISVTDFLHFLDRHVVAVCIYACESYHVLMLVIFKGVPFKLGTRRTAFDHPTTRTDGMVIQNLHIDFRIVVVRIPARTRSIDIQDMTHLLEGITLNQEAVSRAPRDVNGTNHSRLGVAIECAPEMIIDNGDHAL